MSDSSIPNSGQLLGDWDPEKIFANQTPHIAGVSDAVAKGVKANQPPSAAQVATEAQLRDQKRRASTSSLLTGGQGLLDDPKTTSSVLMGA